MRKGDLPRDELGRLRAPGSPDAMAHVRDLDAQIDDPQVAFARGAELFDEQRFFEAMKHFTVAWKADPAHGDDYRTLAQVAAGFCHVQRGNLDGASRVLARALRRLTRASGSLAGVDCAVLEDDVRAVTAQLQRPPVDVQDFPLLPRHGDGGDVA